MIQGTRSRNQDRESRQARAFAGDFGLTSLKTVLNNFSSMHLDFQTILLPGYDRPV